MNKQNFPPLQVTLLDQARVLKEGLDRIDDSVLSLEQKRALKDAKDECKITMYNIIDMIAGDLPENEYNEICTDFGLNPVF